MPGWRKILYQKQKNYPDNYTSKRYFLENIYSFNDAFFGVSRFTFQLNIIFLFYVGHYYIINNLLSLNFLITLNVGIPILATLIYWIGEGKNFTKHLVDVITQALFCCCLTYAVSPILRTLGREIDTDSVYIASGIFFCFSLIFHDFGLSSTIVNMNFSTNISLAASILLISRVNSNADSYFLLVLSYGLFNTFPNINLFITEHFQSNFPFFASSIISTIISIFLYNTYFPLFVSYIFLNIFLLLIIPAVFVNMQRFKNVIHGPWDEATVK
uniref:Phosphatidylinositol N-acetylglucosaminyltransferase subunit C n=1 Tax=Parastrongyloides trichosuri TaxID=131310 RepID=A0A0N4ZQM1_PARTI